jgi:hypothetical protein
VTPMSVVATKSAPFAYASCQALPSYTFIEVSVVSQ